jgi:DNA-binding NarL/FixJ family response regulator
MCVPRATLLTLKRDRWTHNGVVNPSTRLRVLLLEDDAFTRMTLEAFVSSLGHDVVGSASTITEALDAARAAHPDVAVVDLDLGVGPTGVDAAHGLRGVNPNMGILVLSSYLDPLVMGKRARPLPRGSRFLSKQQLGDADRLNDGLLGSMTVEGVPETTASPLDLTQTQIEIMRLVSRGLSNQEIAQRLWLTESGVRRAISRLLRKFELEASKDVNPRVLLSRAYASMSGGLVSDD